MADRRVGGEGRYGPIDGGTKRLDKVVDEIEWIATTAMEQANGGCEPSAEHRSDAEAPLRIGRIAARP